LVPQESVLAEQNYLNIIDKVFEEQLETTIKLVISPEIVLPL